VKPFSPSTPQPSPWPPLTPALLIGFLCLITSATRAAEGQQRVYECRQGGQVIYSELPCGTEQQRLDVQYDEPSASREADIGAATRAEEQTADQTAQAKVLDDEILQGEKKLSRLATERDARVAALKAQRDVGSESRDLNAWLSEMNAKIESTYQRYTNEIIDVQARLDALRARRAALASPPASGSE
jgi:hypothetical protein